jgi:hypothetical protein
VWGWILALLVTPALASHPSELEPAPSAAATSFPADTVLSDDAAVAAHWVADTEDNRGLPFVIVDKRRARLYVFAATGRLVGESPVLLGLSPGDASIPDIASRTPASLAPAERTTPAGRFASEPGHNAQGEDIVWFDYEAALAIHRLRPSPASQRRDERMDSVRSDDKRISYGCIVVPVAFYDAVVRPSLGRQRGVVYVLPETRPVVEMLRGDRLSLRAP